MKGRLQKILTVLCGVSLVGTVLSGYQIWKQLEPSVAAEHSYEQIRKSVFPKSDQAAIDKPVRATEYEPDWVTLKAFNPYIYGWIYSPGTDIDYPVVQGTDNTWYLNHAIDQSEDVVGSIFLECENQSDFSDDISVLYGHHIRGGRMFSSISGYKKQSYYEEHPWLYLYTPESLYRIELFAGTILDGKTDGFPLTFTDEKAREAWLDEIMETSTFQGKSMPQRGERILALCTCSYEYEDARYAIYGIMEKLEIDRDEERKENVG